MQSTTKRNEMNTNEYGINHTNGITTTGLDFLIKNRHIKNPKENANKNATLEHRIKNSSLTFTFELIIECEMPITHEMANLAIEEDWQMIKRWQTEDDHEDADYMHWTESQTKQHFIEDFDTNFAEWLQCEEFENYLNTLEKDDLIKMIKIKTTSKDLIEEIAQNFCNVQTETFDIITK